MMGMVYNLVEMAKNMKKEKRGYYSEKAVETRTWEEKESDEDTRRMSGMQEYDWSCLSL